MNKIIHHHIKLNCTREQAFQKFAGNGEVEAWLAAKADIEPEVGGKYELFWDTDNPEINSTIGCKITAFEQNRLLCFEWKGPVQFAEVMNTADPLTHVAVFLAPEATDDRVTGVHLVHTGWGSGDTWEEARRWFEAVWTRALAQLEQQVNR